MAATSWLRTVVSRLFGPARLGESNEYQPEPMRQETRQYDQPLQLRRWESAETNRLNQSQWCGVQLTSMNDDLEARLETLVARCRHERANNPMVEGVIETYATDVVGREGPHLIVESEDDDYNRTVKQIWTEWFNRCTVEGTSGVELLRRLIGQEFDTGDWLQQYIDMSNELPGSEPVKTRLLDVDPMRLGTPPAAIFSPNIVLGIQRDTFGRPQQYFVRNPRKQFLQSHFDWDITYQPIPAEDILHVFRSREPGQARAFPRLASCLQEIADLRDYDNQVMDAARTAANNGMLLYTIQPEHVAANPRVFSGTIALERQVAKALPPGYQAMGQTSTQPTAQYIDFRHEKLRSLGRPMNMPLLMVLLSAEDSNFSQSRIDLNVIYQRGLNAEQDRIEDRWLNPLRSLVLREAGLAFRAGATARDANPFRLPPRPKQVVFRWGWEPIGQANPIDHVKTQEQRIRLGLTSPSHELANEGKDEDEILDSLAASNAKREKRGLPPLPGPENGPTNEPEDEQNQAPKSGQAGTSKAPRGKRENGRRTTGPLVHA